MHSWLWHTPKIREKAAAGLVWFAKGDMCQYGTPFKKPFQLMFWGIPPGSITFRRCVRTYVEGQCVCSRTRQPHETLRGVSATGEFKTSKAQIYPEAFVEDLVRQMSAWV